MDAEELRSALRPIEAFLPQLTPEQLARLAAHLELLFRWNERINLTAVRESAEAVRKHIGESVFLASRLNPESISICDVGSGAGFPGIPVAIFRPDCQVALVESDVRKSVFLREASRALANVRVINSRFEEVMGDFDCLISRAVNLSAIRRGPVMPHALVLGGPALDVNAGVLRRYEWTKEPVPWGSSGYLWTGELASEERQVGFT